MSELYELPAIEDRDKYRGCRQRISIHNPPLWFNPRKHNNESALLYISLISHARNSVGRVQSDVPIKKNVFISQNDLKRVSNGKKEKKI